MNAAIIMSEDSYCSWCWRIWGTHWASADAAVLLDAGILWYLGRA